MIRLDKFIANQGSGTRTEIKRLIKNGKVSVDSIKVSNPGMLIDHEKSIVTVDGKAVEYTKYEYFMLNKPAGVVSAVKDKNDITVISLIKDAKHKKLSPVGRLDKDTEGLLIITDDGELIHNLISPGKHVPKKYLAHLEGVVTKEHIKMFSKGFKVDNDLEALPSKLEILESKDGQTKIFLTICEGKFHQVKRMCSSIGCKVTYLKRISMCELILDNSLAPGEYRRLTEDEIQCLKR